MPESTRVALQVCFPEYAEYASPCPNMYFVFFANVYFTFLLTSYTLESSRTRSKRPRPPGTSRNLQESALRWQAFRSRHSGLTVRLPPERRSFSFGMHFRLLSDSHATSKSAFVIFLWYFYDTRAIFPIFSVMHDTWRMQSQLYIPHPTSANLASA